MTPRVHKPRPQPPGPAPKLEGCGWFVTHSPDFTPHRPGDVGLGSAAGTRQPLGSGGPAEASPVRGHRTAPTRSLRPEKRQGTPPHRPAGSLSGRAGAKASERRTWGLPGPLPTKVSCVSACLFRRFASFLFCKSGLMTLTFSPSGVSCGSDK